MIDVRYSRGVELPELGLWLDPRGPKDFAFVSHAHADHTGRHAETILTDGTSRLMRARQGTPVGIEHIVPWRERRRLRDFEIMLIPAGHVLGSAQCFIESSAGTLLYTGDFKLREGLSSERAEAEPAETLIMETTFGLPHYVFPPAAEVIAEVVKFCHEALEDGDVPVLLGYSLGKAQEILSALATANVPVMLHGAVWKMTRVYEGLGMTFPAYQKYAAGEVSGHALICPPNVNGSAMLRKIRNRRVAMLSGWAMTPGARFRYQADAAFPLSDHADYTDLLKHVDAVAPKRVLTLHGYAHEFARDLRERGIEAWSLTGANQLELLLPGKKVTSISPPRPLPVEQSAQKIGFAEFAAICEAIGKTTGKLEKVRILREYFADLEDSDLRIVAVWLTGNAFSQVAARPLRVGWAVIRRALLAASGLSPGELQAISRRWNDSGQTTAEALAGTPPLQPITRSVAEVQEFFRRIEAARGPVAKGALLEELLRTITPAEAKILVSILTGELRIGLKEGLVEDAVASAFATDGTAVREANMLLGDLGETAVRARASTLDTIELAPFRPMKSMLASPEPDASAVWDRLGSTGSVWLEDKLDGIRAQLHVANGTCQIYSRELKDITATFPEIAAAATQHGHHCVLDGEMLAYQNGRPLAFAELQRRLGRKELDLFMANEVPVSFLAFDVLWANGRSTFRDPLHQRRAVLDALDLAPPLAAVPVHTADSPETIDAAFDQARDRNNEGLIAKDPASPYAPGRRGLAWIKLKKAFATLDCVIVAAEYGHGKRVGVLSDYTFAVRDAKGGLANIGKAYSGLTDVEIAGLTEELLALVIRQRGRVYDVEPRIVLEIAFDSLNESDRHSSGLAMRFPRIKGIRRDKGPDEIDTIATARRLVR